MQEEVSIICRILKTSPISISVEDAPDEVLKKKTLELSAEFRCKVILYRDREIYGVSNVYNGGSDFEVVEEDCFLVLCEKGKLLISEHTDGWNEKIEQFLD